jgi:hypothetical protein
MSKSVTDKWSRLIAWATWPTQLHVRLYSLPLVALTRGGSFNILAIEDLKASSIKLG